MHVEARVHGRPRIGETASGDVGCVRTVDGVTWVLLVDGLGHGPKAAEAASRAADEHARLTAEMSVEQALGRLHAALEGTRGAAATLLRFGAGTIGFGGVGNVALRTLAGPSLSFVAANGILGQRPLRLRCGEVAVSGSGRLLLFTDGIVATAPIESLASQGVESLGRTLLADHSREHDDATVIDVRYSF